MVTGQQPGSLPDRLPDRTADGRPVTWLFGGAAELFKSNAREVVISGPAGTGKSLAALSKLHYICDQVPNVRCLIIRKTRESLTESGLVTWEQKVLGPRHPAVADGAQRRFRQNYTYPNGSQVIVGGMDKPSKIMSTEFDLVYVQEAIELNEEDWEALLTRLRNGRLPYQQLLADTNPDTPQHWIKQREAAGKLVLLESRHEDNPRLFDRAQGSWTLDGINYLSTLDQLTGPRLQRLRYGKWVQAEGAVYDCFSRAVHVVDMTLPPLDWPRYLSIDFGFTNAFVCLWGAVDPDSRLWIYRQWIKTKMLVEDHAKVILKEIEGEVRIQRNNLVRARREKEREVGEDAAARWLHENMQAAPGLVRPKAIICDHDAEDRATLQKHLGMGTVPAPKAISPGIQAVQSRLRVQADGKPRLLIGRSSVAERDPAMAAAKLPIGVAEEMEGYVWDTRNGRTRGEEPLGVNDHCLDACRYLIAYLDAPKREVRVW